MTDIKTISDEDLRTDLRESLSDIRACQSALDAGITTYFHYPENYVQKRLESNQYFVKVIRAELKRRKVQNDQA